MVIKSIPNNASLDDQKITFACQFNAKYPSSWPQYYTLQWARLLLKRMTCSTKHTPVEYATLSLQLYGNLASNPTYLRKKCLRSKFPGKNLQV